MDDTFRRHAGTVDRTTASLTLTTADATTPRSAAVLTYRRVDREHLLIDGTMDAQDVHLVLTFGDSDAFLQRRRGFHWVSEHPFNRSGEEKHRHVGSNRVAVVARERAASSARCTS